MALIQLTPGNYIVPFIGTTALTIGGQSWFTAQNVNVYKPSVNRAGYIKNAGGSNQSFAPFTQFLPATPGGTPEGYIFEVKATFSVDNSLFGAAVRLAAPTLSAVSPATVAAGNTLTLTGTNLATLAYVLVGGVAATITGTPSATSATVTVPLAAGLGQAVPVVAVTMGGYSVAFTGLAVVAPTPPTITSFSPTSGEVSTVFVITGTNFTGATVVSVNSAAVSSFVVDSATQITAVLTNAQVTGLVRVTTPGGTAISSTSFAVTTPGSVTPVEYALTNADFWDSTFNYTQDSEVFHSGYSYPKFVMPAGVHTFDFYALTNTQFPTLSGIGVRVNGVMQTVPVVNDSTADWYTVASIAEGATVEVLNGYIDKAAYTPMNGNNVSKIRIAGNFQPLAPTVPTNLVYLEGDSILTGAYADNVMTNSIPMLIRDGLRSSNWRMALNGWSAKQLYHQYNVYVDRAAYITALSARLNATGKNVWYCELGTNDINFTSTVPEFIEYYRQLIIDLHKARPDVRIVIQVPTFRSQTAWIEDLQAAVRALRDTCPWVYLVETGVVLADLYLQDGLHLTTGGQAKVAAAAIPIIAPSAAAPSITSFSPSTGGDGIPITITGTNLLGVTDVTIGDERVASFIVNSNTQITAMVSSTQRTGKVAVYGPGGQAYSVSSFVSQIQVVRRDTVVAGSPDMTLTGSAEFANNRIQVYSASGTAVVRGQGTAIRVRYYEQFSVSGYSPLEVLVDNVVVYTIDADHSGVPVTSFAPYSDVTIPIDPASPHTVVIRMVQYAALREIEFIQ